MGANEGQERKSGDFIRGQLPQTALELKHNHLMCGRKIHQGVYRTCFPLLIFDSEGGA